MRLSGGEESSEEYSGRDSFGERGRSLSVEGSSGDASGSGRASCSAFCGSGSVGIDVV